MITVNFTLLNEEAKIYKNKTLLNTYGTNSSVYVLFSESIEINDRDVIEIVRKPLPESFYRDIKKV